MTLKVILKPHFQTLNGRLMAYLCFVFIFSGQSLIGQTLFTTKQLLQLPDSLRAQAHFQSSLNFLTQEKQKLALINEIELRTETDELDLSRQEYLMRLSMSNRKSRRTQDAITQTQIQYYQLQAEAVEAAAVKKRYELILDWYNAQSKALYIRDKLALLSDQKIVYKSQISNSTDFEINDLLKGLEIIFDFE
ncbi:MAG: hypothetical protein AAFN10_28725, partial [Bacteroidota bacterium]